MPEFVAENAVSSFFLLDSTRGEIEIPRLFFTPSTSQLRFILRHPL
jgi:hypothetical protein